MWARFLGSLFIFAGGITCAQSADERATGMESCFQVARLADAVCSRLPDDPAQRLDCLKKTRAAQLECLERVLSDAPAGPSPQASPAIPSRSSAQGALPGSPSENLLLKPSSRTESPASAAAQESSPNEALLNPPGRAESPAKSTDSSPIQAPDNSPRARPGLKPVQRLRFPETTGAISPDRSPKPAEHATRAFGDWVVGETASPVDYSPLVTALIHSTSQEKDAPKTLMVRCRGHRTELMVRTDGAWGTTRDSELHGEYQINGQRAVGQQWILSSDGKTATYKDDPVGLLQSVPDGARLKINIADQSSPSHDAMFRFDGWNTDRKKFGMACQWPASADQVS
jgi:hypothetical protein